MVIDELVVTLGLDPRKFNEGQRQALDSFKKGKDAATDFGKQVEHSAEGMAEAFSVVKKGAIGLVGALAGGEVASFLNHVVAMDAVTGRMAKTIGTTVPNLSAWQNMIRQVGGEAGSATSALSTLQQEINNVRQGGGLFEGGFASLMSQAGASLADDADTSLRKIQAFISGQIKSGRMTASDASTFFGRVPGMNQDMVNLMLDDFKKIEAAARAAGGATEESAMQAREFQKQTSLLTQAFENLARTVFPGLTAIINTFTEAIKQDVTDVKSFLKFFGFGSANASTADDAKKKLTEGLNARAGGGGGPGGTTRGDRNNNPGNMEYGAFARAHGATRSDGRFAVFPDWQTGAAAQQALISGKGYAGLTLHEFAARYAEGAPAWEHTVGSALGLGPNDIVNNQDPRLADAIRRAEGTGARGSANARAGRGGNSSTTTNDVDIHKIEIHAPNATDADGISSELGGALKRQSMIAPMNNALV